MRIDPVTACVSYEISDHLHLNRSSIFTTAWSGFIKCWKKASTKCETSDESSCPVPIWPKWRLCLYTQFNSSALRLLCLQAMWVCWLQTERMRLRIQAGKIHFLCRLTGLSLRERVRSSRADAPLCQKRASWGGSGHQIRRPGTLLERMRTCLLCHLCSWCDVLCVNIWIVAKD